MSVVVVTAPASEPVTLTELKAHCRVDYTTDDDLLTALGVAARQRIEELTGYRPVTQTVDEYLDAWPDGVEPLQLTAFPVASVTSVSYYDSDDVLQVLDDALYWADVNSFPPRLVVADSWPTLSARPSAVVVRYVAGVAVASVPEPIKLAVKWLAAHWYENREAADTMTLKPIPLGVDSILRTYTGGRYR